MERFNIRENILMVSIIIIGFLLGGYFVQIIDRKFGNFYSFIIPICYPLVTGIYPLDLIITTWRFITDIMILLSMFMIPIFILLVIFDLLNTILMEYRIGKLQ